MAMKSPQVVGGIAPREFDDPLDLPRLRHEKRVGVLEALDVEAEFGKRRLAQPCVGDPLLAPTNQQLADMDVVGRLAVFDAAGVDEGAEEPDRGARGDANRRHSLRPVPARGRSFGERGQAPNPWSGVAWAPHPERGFQRQEGMDLDDAQLDESGRLEPLEQRLGDLLALQQGPVPTTGDLVEREARDLNGQGPQEIEFNVGPARCDHGTPRRVRIIDGEFYARSGAAG